MNTFYAIARNGQSLAYGAEGLPVRNPGHRNYYQSYMLGGSVHSGYDGPGVLPAGLPLNQLISVNTESIDMGWALHVGAYNKSSKMDPTVWMYHGWSGYSLLNMNAGTGCYQKGLDQLKRVVALQKAQGYRVVVPCYDFMSGENDSASFSRDWTYSKYANALLKFQQTIQEDYTLITGQDKAIKMMFCQTSSHTFYHQLLGGAGNISNIDEPTCAVVMADLANEYPDRFVMVGAKYHLPYGDGTPAGSGRSVHLNGLGYERWGEKRGEIYLRSILGSEPWKPLQMKAAKISGSKIAIDYDLMFPPIQIDSQSVVDPGNFGYVVRKEGLELTVSNISVAPTGTQIIITLAQPSAGNLTVEYAWKNANRSTYTDVAPPPGYPLSTGAALGPRGCICDSDKTPSLWNHNMSNWAIHQKIKVT